jgi:uncharacterized protein
MRIPVDQISEAPKNLKFAERMDELNRLCGETQDYRFSAPLNVNVEYYRSGRDLFFEGRFEGTVEGVCSRCLETYALTLEKRFDFVLTPELQKSDKSKELNSGELGLSTYKDTEIDLAPYMREQVLLALPIRPLCKERCRGLCQSCGANLNDEPCRCSPPKESGDMGTLRSLKVLR